MKKRMCCKLIVKNGINKKFRNKTKQPRNERVEDGFHESREISFRILRKMSKFNLFEIVLVGSNHMKEKSFFLIYQKWMMVLVIVTSGVGFCDILNSLESGLDCRRVREAGK